MAKPIDFVTNNRKSFFAHKMNGATIKKVEDWIVHEAPLQIDINGDPFTVVMRTPGNDEDLVFGLLYTENIVKKAEHLEVEHSDFENIKKVKIDPLNLQEGYLQERSLVSVSSCGICGKRELKDLSRNVESLHADFQLEASTVQGMFSKMESNQTNFQKTGGTHAAACFDKNGRLLSLREDIGRHNAVDKVIGDLLQKQLLGKAVSLLVSGRISYEIVCKCFKAGIPFLAAVSSPSSLAIEMAYNRGITLLAFCRGETLTCYTHPHGMKEKIKDQITLKI